MDVGQLMELQLGWAAHKLNIKTITPGFNGATEQDIKEALKEARLPITSKIQLFDGRTGQPFDQQT